MAGAQGYADAGGTFDFGFGGSTPSSGGGFMGPFNTLQSNSSGSFNAVDGGGGDIFNFGFAKDTSGWQFK